MNDLGQAEALAGMYARTGSRRLRDRCQTLIDTGASELEAVQQTMPEDGQIQTECRSAQQNYELAAAQIALSIQARQESRSARALQILDSGAESDARHSVVESVKSILKHAHDDFFPYRQRARVSLLVANCLVGILAVLASLAVSRVLAGLGTRRARSRR